MTITPEVYSGDYRVIRYGNPTEPRYAVGSVYYRDGIVENVGLNSAFSETSIEALQARIEGWTKAFDKEMLDFTDRPSLAHTYRQPHSEENSSDSQVHTPGQTGS